MQIVARLATCGLLWLTLTGCGGGKYTIQFEAADVINAPGNDLSREELDIDILTITPAEAEKYPDIVNKTMRSSDWFAARDANDAKIGGIDPNHIYALRRGSGDARRDRQLGAPLISLIDRADKAPVTVNVEHPNPGEAKSALVIYGRFRTMDGMAATPPLVISPAPRMKSGETINIRVGRTDMTCSNCP
jgi:hypothetical protein